MLRRRIITLDITTPYGRPEEYDWEEILRLEPEETLKVVNVEVVDV